MINAHDLSREISALQFDSISPDEFEDWFRVHSRNVHLWGDQELVKAVLALESVLSEYRYDGLSEEGLKRELAEAVRPFEQSPSALSASQPFGRPVPGMYVSAAKGDPSGVRLVKPSSVDPGLLSLGARAVNAVIPVNLLIGHSRIHWGVQSPCGDPAPVEGGVKKPIVSARSSTCWFDQVAEAAPARESAGF